MPNSMRIVLYSDKLNNVEFNPGEITAVNSLQILSLRFVKPPTVGWHSQRLSLDEIDVEESYSVFNVNIPMLLLYEAPQSSRGGAMTAPPQ
jgi:hypothetical protein